LSKLVWDHVLNIYEYIDVVNGSYMCFRNFVSWITIDGKEIWSILNVKK
jgi:hypothetical protein